jgi:hypothetical protein
MSGKYANPVSYSQTVVKIIYKVPGLSCEAATPAIVSNSLFHLRVDGGEARLLIIGCFSSQVATVSRTHSE